jgi:hypothetical protein
MILPVGTFINILAVLVGSAIGLSFRSALSERIKEIAFQATGLFTIALGVSMAIVMDNPIIVIFSILLGGIIGEAIRLDKQIEKLSDYLKERVNSKDSKFTEGLVTAFLIYCIGSLTILGAIEEGTTGDNSLLITKSVLDGFTSIALASTFGSGVAFSVIPMLIFQGGLTIFAFIFGGLFSQDLISLLSATGGLMIIGIGINLLDLKDVRVTNMLPALLLVPVFYFLVDLFSQIQI